MSQVAWKKKILDPISTTDEIFGGDVMNSFVDYVSEAALDSGDPAGAVSIGTATTFLSGKLKLWDTNKSNKITFTTQDFLEDKEIGLPTTLPVSSKLVTDTAVQTLTGKLVDGLLNTLSNIPPSAFAQITDKAKLHSQIAYKDETGWLTDAMVAAHTTTKITTTNKALLNPNILYKDVDNDLGDHFLEFGDITNPSNPPATKMRLFYNQATSAASVIKPSGSVVNLEETVDVTHTGFIPLTKGGLAQFTGNSSQTVFAIQHGLGQTPDQVTIVPASADAIGSYRVTKDATNITVTYQIPPPINGSSNVKLEWGANAAVHASSSFSAGGEITIAANGSATVFNIPHGLTATTPETYFALPRNALAASQNYHLSATTTNIVVTYTTAPLAGDLIFIWGAGFVNEAWEGMSSGTLPAGGTAAKTGNAIDTTFTIPHTLTTVPESYYVLPTSVDARGNYILSVDATNITITYAEPPPSGSNNLTYVWGASYVGGIAEETFTPGTIDTFTNKTIGDYLDFANIVAPPDPSTEMGRLYLKTIDANNNALCVKLQVAGTIQEIQLAP